MKFFTFSFKMLFAILLATLFMCSCFAQTQPEPEYFSNPILSGYHPDPSICRVGDDYYLVNSTFIWYPGIPIYHSKDLVNWELIGHGIHRPDQISLDGLQDRLGIYAVTIRHHDGLFYLITTCVACDGNFYITAEDPAGPWSDPVWIDNSPGIDPSLMWDEDGTCYYTGHTSIDPKQWPTQCGIWTQELDLEQKKLVGRREIFTYGHANNASYTEGAHLYKINGKYLLMASEGGTGQYHSLSVHHSDSIWGPYVADYINPVISHRHLGRDYPIQAIGHGDLVETQNGEWWCVTLGKRQIDGKTTLGRETFLSKVNFEGQTPIFNKGEGKVLQSQGRPNLPWTPLKQRAAQDEFSNNELDLIWCTIRTPREKYYHLSNDHLSLKVRPQMIDELEHSSIVMQRIEHHQFEASTKMSFKTKKENEKAGLIIYRAAENHYQLMKKGSTIQLIKTFRGEATVVETVPYKSNEVFFTAKGNGLDVEFYFGRSFDKMEPIGGKQSLEVIADGNGNFFHGPGIGMYATSCGETSKSEAQFDWFKYQGE